jgi:hypothetical protein
MIHIYAFAEGLQGLPDVAGLDGAPLESRRLDGFDVVVSRRDGKTAGASLRADAIVHGTVVEALVERATAVLPVRFGEEPADEDSLVRLFEGQSPHLRRSLDHVRGCVEVGVRILSANETADHASSGTEYMLARRAAGAGYHELGEQLRALVREVRASHDGAAYLVPRSAVDAVRSAVQRFADTRPELTVVCTGPWAPYSFVGDGG